MINFFRNYFRILLLIVVVFFYSCENKVEEVNFITSENEKKLPVESAQNVEMFYSDSAAVKARLKSPQADRYVGKINFTLFPKGMDITFFDFAQKEESRLTADYGIAYENANGMSRMVAKRNVVVVNKKGEKLNTEHLVWDAVTKKVYTDAFVKITTEDEVLLGDGLIANEDFSEYEIKKPRGTIAVEEETK